MGHHNSRHLDCPTFLTLIPHFNLFISWLPNMVQKSFCTPDEAMDPTFPINYWHPVILSLIAKLKLVDALEGDGAWVLSKNCLCFLTYTIFSWRFYNYFHIAFIKNARLNFSFHIKQLGFVSFNLNFWYVTLNCNPSASMMILLGVFIC